jgi:hypothetical protein
MPLLESCTIRAHCIEKEDAVNVFLIVCAVDDWLKFSISQLYLKKKKVFCLKFRQYLIFS